ncbi:hypothetical protein PCG10_003971 [Penicillium crustosum]|uniref:NmrA-like domain-containing protein n=1 Tax=Penicillium crustosum TaxID=36656 RepID=A0A9P5KZE9_PENCR|nr:hypothetical protein PCG10_003971 [Penicillium crustosum]
MAQTRKLVTVYGATGNQGRSVVKSLLRAPDSFEVRAITRDPNSVAAQELSTLGASLVQADGSQSNQMTDAFQGSWAVFLNINSDDPVFWDPKGPTEFDYGKRIIDSAIMAGVKTLVYSTGAASKNQIETYARSTGAFENLVPIIPGYFLENFLFKQGAFIMGGFPWETDAEGYLTWKVPYWGGDERIPFLSVADDFGDIVHGILISPSEYHLQVVQAMSEITDYQKMTEAFAQVTGKKTRFQPILPTWKAFDASGNQGFEDVKSMFGFTQETQGHYFGREATDDQVSKNLKASAVLDYKESQQSSSLKTVRDWFAREFAA